MCEAAGVKPADVIRIESAGDSTSGLQEVLLVDTEGSPWRALIDRPTNKDKAKVKLIPGWDL